jgi:hypothetical protein
MNPGAVFNNFMISFCHKVVKMEKAALDFSVLLFLHGLNIERAINISVL